MKHIELEMEVGLQVGRSSKKSNKISVALWFLVIEVDELEDLNIYTEAENN